MSASETKRPLRVLLFDHTAALGGGEIALADFVQRFDRSRVDPIVLLGSEGPLEALLRPHVPVYLLPMDAGVVNARRDAMGVGALGNLSAVTGALSYIKRIAKFIEEHDIEIVHTNSLKASVLGGLATRLKRRKLIWHVRDRIADDYLPSKAVTAMRLFARTVPQFIIGNSRATLSTLHLRGTPTAVVPSGVDTTKFFPAPEHAASPIASSDQPAATERKTIGLVGRICPWKGQHIFIEAAAKLHAQWPEARFQIIGAALFGEHDYELELRRMVADAGLEDTVEFLGFQSDIAPLIRALDILVHASIIGEPFGQVIVQGMASGKPVVATDGGGVPESIVDGETGLLVPMGNADALAGAIGRLLTDPAFAARLGEQGLARARAHFTIEQTAEKITAVYEQVSGRVAMNQASTEL